MFFEWKKTRGGWSGRWRPGRIRNHTENIYGSWKYLRFVCFFFESVIEAEEDEIEYVFSFPQLPETLQSAEVVPAILCFCFPLFLWKWQNLKGRVRVRLESPVRCVMYFQILTISEKCNFDLCLYYFFREMRDNARFKTASEISITPVYTSQHVLNQGEMKPSLFYTHLHDLSDLSQFCEIGKRRINFPFILFSLKLYSLVYSRPQKWAETKVQQCLQKKTVIRAIGSYPGKWTSWNTYNCNWSQGISHWTWCFVVLCFVLNVSDRSQWNHISFLSISWVNLFFFKSLLRMVDWQKSFISNLTKK